MAAVVTPSRHHGALPAVAVVLVNYGGWQETLACLESLHAARYPYLTVMVVDNASPNDSVAQLRSAQKQPERYGAFELLESSVNTGFSGGNNLAIRKRLLHPESPEYVWLLNNDTTIGPETLPALVRQAKRTGGVAGSVLHYPDGRFQQGGIRLNPWTGQLRGYLEQRLAADKPVDAVSGASMLIPVGVIERVGLLPEGYFLYVEDVAYCLAVKQAGYSLTVCPESVVVHAEGASTSGKNASEARHKSWTAQYYYQRNRLAVMTLALPWYQRVTVWAYSLLRWGRMLVKGLMGNTQAWQRFVVFHRAVMDALLDRLGQAPAARFQP